MDHIVPIPVCDSYVDNGCHYQRNQEFKNCLQHLKERCKYTFFFIIF